MSKDYNEMSTDELNKVAHQYRIQMNIHNAEQMALKYFMNSVYGAFSNQHFACFEQDVAETITRQGQHLIKFCDEQSNRYFHNYFGKDKELHKKLGITYFKPLLEDVDISSYVDTDSLFLRFDEIYNNTDFDGDIVNFIKKLNEVFLEKFYVKILDKYSLQYNTKNLQVFELEKIARKAIFLGKKKYVLDLAWKMNGSEYKEGEQLSIKGVEIIRADTPKFCKKYLKDIVKYILKEGDSLKIENLNSLIKGIKKEYMVKDIEEILYGKSVNNYDQYVLDDRKTIKTASGTPINVTASASYNFLMNQNPKLKTKYHLIKSGDKIKYYYTKSDKHSHVFGFIPGEFPIEIAPEIDRETMFVKTFINPINRFVEAVIKDELSPNLTIQKKLF